MFQKTRFGYANTSMGLSSGALHINQNVLPQKYGGMIPDPASKCLKRLLKEPHTLSYTSGEKHVLHLQGFELQIQRQIMLKDWLRNWISWSLLVVDAGRLWANFDWATQVSHRFSIQSGAAKAPKMSPTTLGLDAGGIIAALFQHLAHELHFQCTVPASC